jgi:DNA-binding GntR family transcriptional regulator
VRAELEALAVRLALPSLTPADHDVLAGHLGEMLRAADAGDPVAEAAADAAFHAHLVGRCGNTTLERLWSMLEPYSRTYITIAVPGGDRRQMAALHAPVLDALRSGDTHEAESAIRDHFSRARDSLAARWPEDGDAGRAQAFAPSPETTA